MKYSFALLVSAPLVFGASRQCVEQEKSVWINKASFADNFAGCARRSIGIATATTTCLRNLYPVQSVSTNCLGCFGAAASCGRDNCMPYCLADGAAPACLECIATNCSPALRTCTGARDNSELPLPPGRPEVTTPRPVHTTGTRPPTRPTTHAPTRAPTQTVVTATLAPVIVPTLPPVTTQTPTTGPTTHVDPTSTTAPGAPATSVRTPAPSTTQTATCDTTGPISPTPTVATTTAPSDEAPTVGPIKTHATRPHDSGDDSTTTFKIMTFPTRTWQTEESQELGNGVGTTLVPNNFISGAVSVSSLGTTVALICLVALV